MVGRCFIYDHAFGYEGDERLSVNCCHSLDTRTSTHNQNSRSFWGLQMQVCSVSQICENILSFNNDFDK